MNSNQKLKVVMCADYLGTGTVEASTTGFQQMLNDWINQSAKEADIEVVVYCLGTKVQQYYPFPNVTIKQYKPNITTRALFPLSPPSIFPFLVDLIPVHPGLIQDIIKENPDIIHTFGTFTATETSGYIAAKIIKSKGKKVKLVNTVFTEVENYFPNYLKRIFIDFYQLIDSTSLLKIIIESAKGGLYNPSKFKYQSLIFLLRFWTYLQSGLSAFIFFRLFELLGILQDLIVKAVKSLLKFVFTDNYKQLELEIGEYINYLRQSSTVHYSKKYKHWFNYLARPIQLTYDFIRRGDESPKSPKVGIGGLLANILRFLLKQQVSYFVNNCDAVTISRPEDIARYCIKAPVWELPLGCDLSRFKVYQPSVNTFIEQVSYARELEMLSNKTANALIDIVTNPEIVSKRCVLYVGRLSDEKNISILMDTYEQLLQCQGMKDKVHFILIGAGYAAYELEKRFRDSVTVTGLVPNHLLPTLYNFVRLRHGYFVSASDTETYSITKAEAAACGVPLVAMEKGSRKHFYYPGDRIGNLKIEKDEQIARTIEDLIVNATNNFNVALNGLCIPDYSNDKGLSTLLANNTIIETVQKSLLCAMYCMAVLPESTSKRMSKYASELSHLGQFGSEGTWKLLHYIYLNDWKSFYTLYNKKQHSYF
jgi:glycosyltransferase involved in cell wall biosynthesis